jgi:transcriptional regulator with XRE-family HTH domain
MPALKKTRDEMREIKIKTAFTTARINKGWSIQHLAELLGMSSAQVSVIINQPLKRELRTLLRIADKLGVDLFSLN